MVATTVAATTTATYRKWFVLVTIINTHLSACPVSRAALVVGGVRDVAVVDDDRRCMRRNRGITTSFPASGRS